MFFYNVKLRDELKSSGFLEQKIHLALCRESGHFVLTLKDNLENLQDLGECEVLNSRFLILPWTSGILFHGLIEAKVIGNRISFGDVE